VSKFVRWFNRRRSRDGPLFGSRFRSRVVADLDYWYAVVRYIDGNPAEAGLATRADEYPFCSAWHYVRPDGPPWLDRTIVEQRAVACVGATSFSREVYEMAFLRPHTASQAWLVERSLGTGSAFRAPPRRGLDLLRVAAPDVRAELLERANVADGAHRPAPAVHPDAVQEELARRRALEPRWKLQHGRGHPVQLWRTLEAGLLVTVSCLSQREAAARLRMARQHLGRCLERHRLLLEVDDGYAARAAEVASACAREAYE
jgi:hypothetical protein